MGVEKWLTLIKKDWHKQMIYIPQTPYVFEMSLRDNITFYTPNASDEEVIRAIHMVGLDSLLSELPDGLETRIGNGARPLSGGQAQRIALARAFLDQNRRIMVFDEPTAHLDIETELELKEKMLPLMSDRLVIFATHRLHWLNQMDVIVVMEKGRVAEVGSYQELLAKKGYLYQLKHAMGGNNV
ncbi:ABC transporter, ATP-binding protein CydD [Streptococcus agalactiae H36B]|nr:ABC transporter, ATP-binding protein CydD [Streptococcus agalactiae H36B]